MYLFIVSWLTSIILKAILCFINVILALILLLLYAVKYLLWSVLKLYIVTSDNLPLYIKQQPTNRLRDFTQLDAYDDSKDLRLSILTPWVKQLDYMNICIVYSLIFQWLGAHRTNIGV